MRDTSEAVTQSIIKTVYYTEGPSGITCLLSYFNNVLSADVTMKDCYRIYNLIIYSCPFMLWTAFDQNALTSTLLFHSPYEVIVFDLHAYVSSYPFEELTFPLRVQTKLECSVPDFREVSEMCQSFLRHRRFGAVTAILIGRFAPVVVERFLEGERDRFGAITVFTSDPAPLPAIVSSEDFESFVLETILWGVFL
jgi:hypothetical protein